MEILGRDVYAQHLQRSLYQWLAGAVKFSVGIIFFSYCYSRLNIIKEIQSKNFINLCHAKHTT